MTATLTLRGVGATRGARTLFSDLDLVVAEGDVWGLTGPNGAGKSTLLEALAGRSSAEVEGEIAVSPPEATVGLLRQEPDRLPGETVAALLGRITGVDAAREEMERAAFELGTSEAADERYAVALERWLSLGGGDLADRIPGALARLGLDPGIAGRETVALSGGQAARISLAAIVLSEYDVLLLDEPTNDLDLAGLEVLERFVRTAGRPMVVVSHDREFLSRCVTGIVELDSAQRSITVFEGGYEAYLAERELTRRRAREAYEEYAGRVDSLHERLQTQKTWLDKGVRSAMRMTGGRNLERDKHIRHRAGQRTEKQAGKISQTERAIERLEEVAEPRKEWELRMHVAAAPRSGTVVAVCDGAVVTRGEFRLGPVSLRLDAGDRVLVGGPNGAGKSTLLALLTGRVDPDEGRASTGAGVEPGRVDQARAAFSGPTPLLEVFCARTDPARPVDAPTDAGIAARRPGVGEIDPTEARTLLAKFGLGGEHVTRPCDSLSPGERTRAALALLQHRGVNLLVLDEPTNHLDLPAIEQLESAVEEFGGTVLLVTHDRRMRAAFRATRELRVTGGEVVEVPPAG